MAANAPVGGLYLTVKLDVNQAIKAFDALKTRGTDVITSLGAVSSGISKAIANEVAKSERELQRLGKVAQQQAQIVNASFQRPKAPKTPLAAETAKLRSDIKKSGVSRDFINDLGATGDVAGLQKVRAQLDALRKAAEQIKVNAVDPVDIAEAEKLLAKIKSLEAAAKKATDKATGVTSPKGQQTTQTGLNKTTQAAQKTTKAVKQTTEQLDKSNNSARNVGQAALALGSNLGGVIGALKTGNIGFAINYLFTGLSRSLSSLASVGPVAAAALIAVGAAAATFAISAAAVIVSLKEIGTAGIKAGNELQTLEIALQATLGTAGAEKELAFLTDRAESSVFDVKGLTAIDRTLTAYNVLDTELRQGLVDSLITLGTVGGKSIDELQFGARALGQVFSTGTLKGTEVLQLVNSLGIGRDVLKELPKYATLSGAALLDLQERGLIPAADVFAALEARASTFGAVAERAALTVEGQLSKLREDLPASIGFEFLGAGVQEQLTNLLGRIYEFLSSIDFTPIANGFATVFKSLDSAAKGFVEGSGGTLVKNFVQGLLPAVLTFVAQAVKAFETFGIALRPVLESLELFTLVLGVAGARGGASSPFAPLIIGIGALAKMLLFGIETFKLFVNVTVAATKVFLNAGRIIGKVAEGIGKALKFDFTGAGESLAEAWTIATGDLTSAFGNFVRDFGKGSAEIDKTIAEALAITNEGQRSFQSTILGRIQLPEVEGPSEEERKKLEDQLKDQIKFFEDLGKKFEEARKELQEFTDRWFGLRSELEKGFLGDKDFEATVDSIAGTGKRLIEILRGVGQFAVASDIDRSTRRLIDLARLRDQVAEQLKAAEQKLADAIQSRDEFANRVREQSIAFVNTFKLEEEEVERLTNVSAGGGITGYLVSRTKEIKSFVQSLRDRLKTLKEFRASISALAARGLDRGLLEQLVAAGPEQAGDVVKQLSQSGDGVIQEVNAIQKELGDTAEKYGDENARRFYQAGVDTAQAQADGLRFGLKAIQNAAQDIVNSVYDKIRGLAAITGELGAQAAIAFARALTAGAQIGLLNIQAAANDAIRKTAIIQQLSAQVFSASQRIEKEFLIRAAEANARSNPISRAAGLIAAEAFRTQEYLRLNAEVDRLASTPSISVYIGDKEIDAIVRAQVDQVQRNSAVAAGTRR